MPLSTGALGLRKRSRGIIGKTVRIRRGAAAVFGQAPDNDATARGREGGPGAVRSRKPEDLPVELLFRCFGH